HRVQRRRGALRELPVRRDLAESDVSARRADLQDRRADGFLAARGESLASHRDERGAPASPTRLPRWGPAPMARRDELVAVAILQKLTHRALSGRGAGRAWDVTSRARATTPSSS